MLAAWWPWANWLMDAAPRVLRRSAQAETVAGLGGLPCWKHVRVLNLPIIGSIEAVRYSRKRLRF